MARMAERWQRWMPFHIDRFMGSREVQAMHPAAKLGYIYLLASCWQSKDCTTSSDPIDLATASSLGDELWAVHGPRIMRKFVDVGEGRVRNEVLLSEWTEAKKVYEKRKSGAVRTNESRSASGERTQSSRNTDTVTETVTNTRTPKTSTLASTAVAVTADRGGVVIQLPVNSGSDFQVRQSDVSEWNELYPAVDVGQQLKNIKGWILGNPKNRKTSSGMGRFIHAWLSKEQNRAKPTGGFNAPTTPTQRTMAAAERYLQRVRDGESSISIVSSTAS